MIRACLLLLPSVLVAVSCGPLVQVGGNSPRPAEVHQLTPTGPAAAPAGLAPVDMGTAISVGVPTVPGTLQTLRIPVTVSDTAVQYVTGAVWSEQPGRLFQRLLADRLTAGGVAVIDVRSAGVSGGRRLTGQLMAFGVDVRAGPSVVTVRYDATLGTAGSVRQRQFVRTVPLAAVEGRAVATALNDAANLVAADVAAWIYAPGN